MSDFATAICDRALPDNAASENAPEWVHLFPSDVMTGRDGRTFNLADPQSLVQAFEAGNIDLPIDYEHQNDKRETQANGPIPAAGWIKELKVKADGLWGRVEWTAQASELLRAKAYRYLSPSFLYQKSGKIITKLKGAGLVHNPNLHLTALASQEDAMNTDMPFIERLAALLKLSPDTGEDEVFAALEKLIADTTTPDPKKFVPIEALQEALLERNTGRASMSEDHATAKVNDAMQRGFISPAMKEWATALCQQDEGSFDSFIEKSTPQFAHLFKPSGTSAMPPKSANATAHISGSDQAEAVCQQLGLKSGTLES